jgi:hypothetical protein
VKTAVANAGLARESLPRPLVTTAAFPARVDDWLDTRRALAWVLATVVLAATAVIAVVPAATGRGGVSPLDEFWYTDALAKADRGELSNTGDRVGDYARQVMACRGVVGVNGPTPACGVPQPDSTVPLGGVTAADVHPPTYFFLTAAMAKVVRFVGLTDDVLISGRLVGVVWLTLGMLAMVRLGRVWGARWVVPLLTAVATGTSPLLVSVTGYLTPDALGLLVGGASFLALQMWLRGRLPTALLFVAALVPAFVKVPLVLAPLFGALLLGVAWLAGQLPFRRALTGASLLVVGAGAGAILWQTLRGVLAVGAPVLHPDADQPVAVSSFAKYFGYYLDVIPVSSGAPIPVSSLLAIAVQPLAWLLLATAVGGLLFRRREDPLLPVCWAGTTGMVMGSIVLSVIVLVASGGFLIGTPRYGLALLPLFAVPLMCTRHPVVVLGLLASASASVVSHLLLW